MKVNLSEIFLMSIFVGVILAGTHSVLIDYAFSENSSYIVVNPDFANDKAVGNPILPIPTTQTEILLSFMFCFISAKSC